MAYSNSFSLAEQYLPILDGIYKAEAKTAVLDSANERVRFIGGNKVDLFKMSLNGLGDYSRNAGFPNGSATGTWETLTLAKDRGRGFLVDAMDNEETLGMAFGTMASEFLRTQLVPEIDAYTFAKIAGTSNISSANADITVGTTDVPSLIDTAEMTMGDNEVPMEGRILFVSEKAYAGLKAKITRKVDTGNPVLNNAIEYYDGMRVVVVPKNRFNTAITMYDGTTSGEEAGGYIVPASTSYAINFMIVHPSAIVKVVKHAMPRIFSPEQNPTADGWLFQYRAYYDVFVLANKLTGVYMHRASTANA